MNAAISDDAYDDVQDIVQSNIAKLIMYDDFLRCCMDKVYFLCTSSNICMTMFLSCERAISHDLRLDEFHSICSIQLFYTSHGMRAFFVENMMESSLYLS